MQNQKKLHFETQTLMKNHHALGNEYASPNGKNLYCIKQRKGGIQLYHLSSQLHHFCENDQIEFSPSKVKIQWKSEWKVKIEWKLPFQLKKYIFLSMKRTNLLDKKPIIVYNVIEQQMIGGMSWKT